MDQLRWLGLRSASETSSRLGLNVGLALQSPAQSLAQLAQLTYLSGISSLRRVVRREVDVGCGHLQDSSLHFIVRVGRRAHESSKLEFGFQFKRGLPIFGQSKSKTLRQLAVARPNGRLGLHHIEGQINRSVGNVSVNQGIQECDESRLYAAAVIRLA